MPELPEIEHVRCSLEPALLGATVANVQLHRPDVLRPKHAIHPLRGRRSALLNDARIASLRRHGKQLAIVATDGRVLVVQLGMTGEMQLLKRGQRLPDASHVHCTWKIIPAKNKADAPTRVVFRDPRRFGGLTPLPDCQSLNDRWSKLGPDGLDATSDNVVTSRLQRTTRAIKAALLDQAVIAGVGNIYADESLFRSRIHPQAVASTISPRKVRILLRHVRDVLSEAVEAGGSTIRNYVDANGEAGWFKVKHQVYGRAGDPCVRCGKPLEHTTVAQRTTTFCPRCQKPG